MSEIKNGRFDQYGAEPFEQQQFGTAGVQAVMRKVFQQFSRNLVELYSVVMGKIVQIFELILFKTVEGQPL